MTPGPKYLKRSVFMLTVLVAFQMAAYADTVTFKDGSQVKGVMLREEDDKIVFTTEKGDEIFKRPTIDRIIYDNDEENTLTLAEYNEKKDKIKAFNLYEKAYRINPQSERAVNGMTRLQDNVYKSSSGRALAVNYERFQTPVDDKLREVDILDQNAVQAERVQKDLGIILATKDFRQNTASVYYTKVKIVDVVNGSRAFEAGVRLGDYLVNIEGYASGRMGLYDAISLLAKNASGPVSIVVERNIDLFVRQDEMTPSVFELVGLSVEESGGGVTVSAVEPGSSASAAGLVPGDVIIAADYGSVRLSSKADLEGALKHAIPGNVNLSIRRKINIK